MRNLNLDQSQSNQDIYDKYIYQTIWKIKNRNVKHQLLYILFLFLLYAESLLIAYTYGIHYSLDPMVHIDRMNTLLMTSVIIYWMTNANRTTIVGVMASIIFCGMFISLETLEIFAFSYSYPLSNWSKTQWFVLLFGSSIVISTFIWSIIVCIKKYKLKIITSIFPLLYLLFVLTIKTNAFHIHHYYMGFMVLFMIQTTSLLGELIHSFFLIVWISGLAIYGNEPLWKHN
jgi:hypothetical protein